MTTRIHLLLVTKSTGGVAEYIRWLLNDLDKVKFHITVACLSENGRGFADELRKRHGIETVYFEMDRYRIDPVSDSLVCWKLKKLLSSRNFDLIHAHASKPGLLARIAAAGSGIPVLYSPHCFAFHAGAEPVIRLLTSCVERLMTCFTERIVAIAEGERELARLYFVGWDNLFTVIHTGIDPAPFRRLENIEAHKVSLGIPISSPVIGSVGRLNRQKSPFDFIQVAAKVRQTRPEVHFIWIGDGPLEKESRDLARTLGLGHTIHWLGQRSDVPQLLHVIDCLVLTSLWEGLPLVVLEAMSAGTPVVATDILGTRELISHEVNGFLASVGDHYSLARFALEILSDSAKKERFVSAGHDLINLEFTRAHMMEKLQNLYLEVASKRVAHYG